MMSLGGGGRREVVDSDRVAWEGRALFGFAMCCLAVGALGGSWFSLASVRGDVY